MDSMAAPTATIVGAPTVCAATVRCRSPDCRYLAARSSDTCCRACAARVGHHDDSCLREQGRAEGFSNDSYVADADIAKILQAQQDLELAAALQQQEAQFAQQEQVAAMLQQREQHEASMEAGENARYLALVEDLRLQSDYPGLWDPVWGQLTVDGEVAGTNKQLFWFWCPCVAIGCGSSGPSRDEVCRAWKRFLLSWSSFLALVQLVMLVVAIAMVQDDSTDSFMGLPATVLDRIGAKNAARILRYGEWWRLLSPLILHVGWVHLIGNLLVQLRTGVMLEALWGHKQWLLIYVWTGAFASLTSCVLSPDDLAVGSSGALCGLIGAWLTFILITWNQTLPRDRQQRNSETFAIGSSIIFIVALSWMPMIDFASHIGGLVAGGFIAMMLFAGRLQSTVWRIGVLAAGVAGSLGLAALMLWLFVYRTELDETLLYVH